MKSVNKARKMDGTRRTRRIALAMSLVASSAAVSSAAFSGGASASTKHVTITLAASQTYIFDTAALDKSYYTTLKSEFQKEHPGVTLQIEDLPGSYQDILNKLALLYRSQSTAPDVAQFGGTSNALFASSGYLAPLNSYLKSASWWKQIPPQVQSLGTYDGTVYSVSQGFNSSAMVYNEKMFQKAGIPVPWQPKSWADVISAAKKLKAALPGVIPLWLFSGTSLGSSGLLQGGLANFIAGSSTPTIYDSSTKKWVVDSPGIRQALKLWQETFADGLGAPATDLSSPSSNSAPPTLFKEGKLAMAAGINFWPGMWTKLVGAPYWKQAAQTMGVTPIPTVTGQGGNVASTLSSWNLGVAKSSPHKKLAFDLISLMEQGQNMINSSNWIGWIPPERPDWSAPGYANFAPGNKLFGEIALSAKVTPTGPGFETWAQGMEEATGLFVQNPKATVAQAIQLEKSFITGQLGASKVETLK
jgi:multiple sugar transport system substrate-binding protein